MVQNLLEQARSILLKSRLTDISVNIFPRARGIKIVREYVIARKIVFLTVYNTCNNLAMIFVRVVAKYGPFFGSTIQRQCRIELIRA